MPTVPGLCPSHLRLHQTPQAFANRAPRPHQQPAGFSPLRVSAPCPGTPWNPGFPTIYDGHISVGLGSPESAGASVQQDAFPILELIPSILGASQIVRAPQQAHGSCAAPLCLCFWEIISDNLLVAGNFGGCWSLRLTKADPVPSLLSSWFVGVINKKIHRKTN